MGLIPFSTTAEALDGLDRIASDWAAHSASASEIAREYFDAGKVLPPFLDVACS
jgi:hypothetical protein